MVARRSEPTIGAQRRHCCHDAESGKPGRWDYALGAFFPQTGDAVKQMAGRSLRKSPCSAAHRQQQRLGREDPSESADLTCNRLPSRGEAGTAPGPASASTIEGRTFHSKDGGHRRHTSAESISRQTHAVTSERLLRTVSADYCGPIG